MGKDAWPRRAGYMRHTISAHRVDAIWSQPIETIAMPLIETSTERLLLRAWRDSDLPALVALNADAEVMRHFPAPMDA